MKCSKFFSALIVISAFLLVETGIAQTGPAGVGNSLSNGVWLKSSVVNQTNNSLVPSWADVSGNNNDAGQTIVGEQPIFLTTSAMNGQPVLRFDGVNDQMTIADADILDGTSGVSFYAALRCNNLDASPRGILGKRITFTVASEYAYTFFFHTGGRLFNDIHTQNNRFGTANVFANSINYVVGFDFDGTLPTSQRGRIFNGGVKTAQSGESSTTLPNSNQPLTIGALNYNYGIYLGADYGEIIHFNYSLDSVEHILVQNYLSAKFNSVMSVNDIYKQDDPANGNFDFQMIGIGRVNANTIHDNSIGDGLVGISNPSDLNDDEFLMIGHEGGDGQASNILDIPSGLDARLDRVWRMSETNSSGTSVDVGSIDVRWDLSLLGPVVASDLRLLIDTDNDGVFIDETPISGAVPIAGGLYQFNGVTGFADNLRFTLGTINNINTPLPVTLLNFDSRNVQNGSAELWWETASEQHSNYFELQHSLNAQDYTAITRLQAAGNSSSKITYNYHHDNLSNGLNFYRLKQVDLDGDFEFYGPITVHSHYEKSQLYITPNPTNGRIELQSEGGIMSQVIVFNSIGAKELVLNNLNNYRVDVDLSGLSNGIYFIAVQTLNGKRLLEKVIKK